MTVALRVLHLALSAVIAYAPIVLWVHAGMPLAVALVVNTLLLTVFALLVWRRVRRIRAARATAPRPAPDRDR